MSSAARIMVMHDGDLPSAVALALEPEPRRVVLWHAALCDGSALAGRQRSTSAQAAWLALETPTICRQMDAGAPAIGLDSHSPALVPAHRLLTAALDALARGCTRLVSPLAVRGQFDQAAAHLKMSMLVQAMVEGDPASRGLAIDLPVVDLTDGEIVQLAQDLGVGGGHWWPCLLDDPRPCERCDECQRWREACESVGWPWPWGAGLPASTTGSALEAS